MKRRYVKTTLDQKLGLTAEFERVGDALSDIEYSTKFGIPLKNTQKLLTSLRKGQSILPKGHYSRKSRVIPYQHIVKRLLANDPSITIKKLRECLICGVEGTEGDGDTVNNVDNPQPREDSGIDGGSSETGIVQQNQESQTDQSTVPSESAIRKFLVGITGNGEEREVPVFSFKRETPRMPGANTAENKEKRVQAIQELRSEMAQGYQWVCIDETSWSVGNTPAFGWARRGEKCFITKSRNGIRLTSIAAIDGTGMSYCSISPGTHNVETFSTHFKRLIKRYDEVGIRCVLWVDNCGIHHLMISIAENSRHCVVFNATYSPELTSIENVFGIWKRRAERDIRTFDGLQDLLAKIGNAFETLEQREITSSFERCRNDVWPMVFEGRNL